ncbi:MAG: hypothetical protein EZS28_042731 [Streblomastix strix]|uniref:Uncharacterized protein n=1 Tax=Streblomastix strix TaxID=222440 RepID=A0A5J4TV39_9EUKA|nr:MAG: hypothetical protein EZS28_042731 [Streblomastix strix]
MDYINDIYGDTESLCLASASQDWPVKGKKLWEELHPHFFPSTNDYYDIKKIHGYSIYFEVTTYLALALK